jgi:hypothetical protein
MTAFYERKRVIDTTNKRTGYVKFNIIAWHGGGYSNLWAARRTADITYCELNITKESVQ